jgi:hypothetical protein
LSSSSPSGTGRSKSEETSSHFCFPYLVRNLK